MYSTTNYFNPYYRNNLIYLLIFTDFRSSDSNLIKNALGKKRLRDEQILIVNRLLPIRPAPRIDLDDLNRALHTSVDDSTPVDSARYDNTNNNNNILSITY